MSKIDYKKLDDTTKDLVQEWIEVTGDLIAALGQFGYAPSEALMALKSILVVKNLKYL